MWYQLDPKDLASNLTKREVIAKDLLSGLLSNGHNEGWISREYGEVTREGFRKLLAQEAIALTDELLKQLNNKPETA